MTGCCGHLLSSWYYRAADFGSEPISRGGLHPEVPTAGSAPLNRRETRAQPRANVVILRSPPAPGAPFNRPETSSQRPTTHTCHPERRPRDTHHLFAKVRLPQPRLECCGEGSCTPTHATSARPTAHLCHPEVPTAPGAPFNRAETMRRRCSTGFQPVPVIGSPYRPHFKCFPGTSPRRRARPSIVEKAVRSLPATSSC